MAGRFVPNLLLFTRTLRAAGLAVRAGGALDAVQALDIIGLTNRADVHDALRAVLVSRREDLAPFDRLFDRFWRPWRLHARNGPRPMQVPPRAVATVRGAMPGAVAGAGQAGDAEGAPRAAAAVRTYSADEIWRRKDFAVFTAEDVARARAALAALAWDPGVRVTRRWIAGGDQTIDLRRLIRSSARHAGEPVVLPYRLRRLSPRPLILICDVSGSMEPYARMLLLFAHAIAGGSRRVEVFVFATRLTRVTQQFATASLDAALARVRDAVRDWSGGTRIGDAVRAFNAGWARRVLRHDPVVLLISDGWDLGDPELLAREMARLQRSARRLIWLNPLLGSPDYEPLTRGMQAALPHVDDFLPVHDMSSLESLAARLNVLADRRAPRGARYRRRRRASATGAAWN